LRRGCSSDATSSEIEAFANAECVRERELLQDNDSLEAGLAKLMLAAVSAACVWGVVWVTCVYQLGSHSLGGWVLEVLLVAWRVVVWLWRFLLWRPPAWYPVQVKGYGA
jgi:hypothetical protein